MIKSSRKDHITIDQIKEINSMGKKQIEKCTVMK